MSTNRDAQNRVHELETKRAALTAELQALADRDDAGAHERVDNLTRGLAAVDQDIAEQRAAIARHERLPDIYLNHPERTEAGAVFHTPTSLHGGRRAMESPIERVALENRDDGLRSIEHYADRLTPAAADRLDQLVRGDDLRSLSGKYLAAVGDPAYRAAWTKVLADPQTGYGMLEADEAEAMRRVSAVMAERALSTYGSGGAAGGYAVPFTLDPTVMLSSDGSVNPIRQLARVTTISGSEWKGVSSTGITAAYAAEGEEAGDDSPTLAQPTIKPERAQAFVPYSIEVGMDWSGLEGELGRMFRDAKDQLEATAFLTGTGTGEPQGVLARLGTAERVQTAGTAALATGDAYDLKQALPPRFVGSATVTAAPGTFDRFYRLVGTDSAEPPLMPTRDGAWLGLPARQWSTMDTDLSTGKQVAIVADFAVAYTIVDRLGLTVELVPQLPGPTRGYPTGQRGLYAIWRTGAAIVVSNAARYLEVKG